LTALSGWLVSADALRFGRPVRLLRSPEKKRQEFARSLEERKEARDDRATLAVARGAAREWARRLGENPASIDAAIRHDHWWPSPSDVQMFAVHDDRKLVVSMLSGDEFAIVERAESSLYNALSKRDIVYEDDLPSSSPLPSIGDDAEWLGRVSALLGSAELVLRSVGSNSRA